MDSNRNIHKDSRNRQGSVLSGVVMWGLTSVPDDSSVVDRCGVPIRSYGRRLSPHKGDADSGSGAGRERPCLFWPAPRPLYSRIRTEGEYYCGDRTGIMAWGIKGKSNTPS
eukprot:2016395-Karenia_brevis.AAC.1